MRFVVLLICVLGLASYAKAEKRVALVVGNSSYEYVVPLSNPKNDAESVAAALGRLEFEVIKGIDLTRTQFVDKVREFAHAVKGADIAVLFYAGHGLQVDGRNYLAPVETRLLDETDLEFETVRLETIISQMEREPRTNLVFLDACRNNPMARNLAMSMGTRSAAVGRGLAPIETGIGTLIAFATQPGNVALDGEGKNSPFTEALVKYIETPGEDIGVLMRRVRQEVIDKTNGQQVPWDNSSLTGSVILKQLAAPDAVDSQHLEKSDNSLEIAYWQSIRDASDKSFFESYLRQFPDGSFTELAKLKISLMENQKETDLPGEVRLNTVNEPLASPNPQDLETDGGVDLVRSIQQELNRLGCDAGAPDGVWGEKSSTALRRLAKERKRQLASIEPNTEILKDLLEMEGTGCAPKIDLDGLWYVELKAVTCNWKQSHYRTFSIKNGKIDGDSWDGNLSPDGESIFKEYYSRDAKTFYRTYRGKIDGSSGSGTFVQSDRSCSGKFKMNRR